MATLAGFNVRMQTITTTIGKNVGKKMKSAAISVLKQVVRTTPVDTGAARSNWRVDVGVAPVGEIPAYFPYIGFLATGVVRNRLNETTNARFAIAVGELQLARFIGPDSIFISNEVKRFTPKGYIQVLNRGRSRQAPRDFVRKAVNKALSGVSNVRVIP